MGWNICLIRLGSTDKCDGKFSWQHNYLFSPKNKKQNKTKTQLQHIQQQLTETIILNYF